MSHWTGLMELERAFCAAGARATVMIIAVSITTAGRAGLG